MGPINDSDLKVGTRVQVQGKIGTICFVGTTSFQTGKWVGIELDEPMGKNSGVVQGKRYFDCRLNHGVFVRPSQVKIHLTTPPSSTSEDDQVLNSPLPNNNSTDRFAPPQDPSLASARSVQQRTPSPSSTLLPSRIASPGSRIGRLQQQAAGGGATQQTGLRRPMIASPRSSVVPTASITTGPGAQRKSVIRRPRSDTQGSSITSPTQREAQDRQLQQLREQQLRLRELQEQQQLGRSRAITEDPSMSSSSNEPTPTISEQEEHQAEDGYENEMYALQKQNIVSPSPVTTAPPMLHQPQVNNAVYGTLAPSMPISRAEQTVPIKDYEELRLKLKILETKRQEDRERHRENEKIKEEAEQFLTLRNKLQDKIGELQKDLRETKRQLKDTSADRDQFESKYMDIIESMEMMTLDKEVAEERAENLQQEVNMLKDKIEEISVDLDILKKEADILNRAPESTGDEKTPLEVIQLERHNERLKEALMRLRDAAAEQEADMNRKIKSIEKENSELEEYRGQYERVQEQLNNAELQIDDLKQRLDDAIHAEDLVEQLTERNLTLNEKVDEMKVVVEDLEALKDLADELEENHIETEKQLQAEIDHRDMLLREQLDRIRSAEDTNADYETTIQQFRELVMTLQSDLEQLRQQEVTKESEKHNLSSQSQAMMSLNMQLQSTVMKANAKAVDLELRKLDAAQANDRLDFVQPYLPDSFFKTENDPISCLLLFKRLAFKSELIIKQLDQNHPISEKIMDTVNENLITVCEMRQRAGWLGDLAKRFVTFIQHCNPEIFTRMGQVFHDLVSTERRLNGIVELLRTDELNESECLMDLQRMIAQLEHLAEVHLAQHGELILVDQFFGLTRGLDLNADRMTVELTFVRQAVENSVRKEGISITEGEEKLDYDYIEPLGRLISQAKNSKIMAKKLLRQLEDLSEQALMLKTEHLHSFKTLYAISSKLSQFCFEAYKQIAAYVSAKRGSKEEMSLSIIQQIVYNKADEILEIAETSLWEGCLRTLKSLTNELNSTIARVDNDSKMDKIVTGIAPWIQRASDMKAEVVISHDMERKLQQHTEEILKLIKDIKLKDQALQESSVKVELLEKRMADVKKQAEQISVLEEQLTKSQTQEGVYAEEITKLRVEMGELEQEHTKLKATAAQSEMKWQIASDNKKSNDSANTSEANSKTTHEVEAVSSNHTPGQVETLKAAIQYLRSENAHLKARDMATILHLEKLPESTKSEEEEAEGGRKTTLKAVALEARVLLKDMRVAGAAPKVVALDAGRRQGKWQSRKRAPDYQYQAQQSVLYTLKYRSDQLRGKLERVRPSATNTTTTTNTTNTSARSTLQSLSRSIAKIQIPGLSPSSHRIQLSSAAEFERIHSVFLR